jgi:hypothetical protein
MKASGGRPFRSCGSCGRLWQGWEEFVLDPELRLLGLQAVPDRLDASVLVFEHRCGSSVSVLTRRLRHLLPDAPAGDWPSLRGTEQCPGHCLSLEDLAACDRPCSNARDRDLIKVVQRLRESLPVPVGPGHGSAVPPATLTGAQPSRTSSP